MGGEPDTSGTPTLETDSEYESTYDDMRQARKAEEVTMSDLRYATWCRWGLFKHIFGIHTFVPLEVWDTENGSMQYIGRICWHCQERST